MQSLYGTEAFAISKGGTHSISQMVGHGPPVCWRTEGTVGYHTSM